MVPKLKLLTQAVPERVYPLEQVRHDVGELMQVTQGEMQAMHLTG